VSRWVAEARRKEQEQEQEQCDGNGQAVATVNLPFMTQGRGSKFSHAIYLWIKDTMYSQPEATLGELCVQLSTAFEGIQVSKSTMSRWISKLGYSVKRVTPVPPKRDTPELQEQRRVFGNEIQGMDASEILFVDETAIDCRKAPIRRYGRSQRGEPVHVTQPLSRGRKINAIVGVGVKWDGNAGQYRSRLVRKFVEGRGAKGVDFVSFVRESVLPLAADGENGDGDGNGTPTGIRVVMDNCVIHKFNNREAQRVIENEGNGAVHFLPPYSPDLNPIECFFGQVKKRLQREYYWSKVKAGVQLTNEDVWQAFQREGMDVDKLMNFIRHSGYRFGNGGGGLA